MEQECSQFLNLRHQPGMFGKTEVCWTLGINGYEFDALLACKLLKPLGANPPVNAPKWFAGCEIRKLAQDAEWLHKARTAIVKHWAKRNRLAAGNGSHANGMKRMTSPDFQHADAQ